MTETQMQIFAPGDLVVLAARPGWGCGQVQSVVGARITVNFEHRGKQVIDTRHAVLQRHFPAPSEISATGPG